MRLKINGGTANHTEPSLCLTCRHATVVRGRTLGDEIIECGYLSGPNRRMAFPVTFCNAYVDRTHPTVREMEEIAWVLRTDAKRNQVGFVRASDLKPKDRFVLTDEWP
ncbi:MAG TPA: hypothetical protein VMO26_17525 [Vicinamibacterales bacterium]|nr:hypothetical protein [Vicinamibacterales bacterium]